MQSQELSDRREEEMLGELEPPEIEELLRSEVIGRIGCHAEGRTYVVPVTYAYDGESVYGHSGEGMKLRMMRRNPRVCFQVEHVEDISNWRSVIAWGTFTELSGDGALRAMDLLIARLSALPAGESGRVPYVAAEPLGRDGRSVVLYRIRLTEKTGRFERT